MELYFTLKSPRDSLFIENKKMNLSSIGASY